VEGREEVAVRARLSVVLAVGLVGIGISPVAAGSLRGQLPGVAQEVGIQGGSAFDAMADALADSAARNIPLISASAGFTYSYNPTLEVFERTSDTLGPLFVERPDTIGRGKFNVNVSWQYTQLDEYDGADARDLHSPDQIIVDVRDINGTLVRRTANDLRYNLKLITNIVGLSATYGVLDNLDVNILVPLLDTNFDVTANRMRQQVALPGGPFEVSPGVPLTGKEVGDKFGVGDIFLRAKYQLPREDWLRWAAGLQFRLPSGKNSDFQGTGSFEAIPYLTLSTLLWSRVEPHAVFGIDFFANDVSRSQADYDLGVDVDIIKRVGVTIAFLGRSEFSGIASSGSTNFAHLTPTGVQQEPLLGLNFGRKDYFDFSFGARAVVWRQVMLFANGIYALNSEGFRSSVIIPTVGVEATF